MEQKYYTLPEIKQKMVNYCVYQDRCHKEVEQKFWDFILDPVARDEILLYLLKENYLNEERFARSFARGKFYQKNWGKTKIIGQLKFKGITEKLIKIALTEIDLDDYEKTAQKLLSHHFDLQKTGKDFIKVQKSIKYMMSKGYEYDVLARIKQNIS